MNETHTSSINERVRTFCPQNEGNQLHVTMNGAPSTLVVQDKIGERSFPCLMKDPVKHGDASKAGVLVLPVEGVGRTPIVNEGELVTPGLLQGQLAGALDETHFTPALNQRLDNIPRLLSDGNEERGFGKHDEVIQMGLDWSARPPRLFIDTHIGVPIGVVKETVGVEPNCITYTDIPDQEVIFGHSGVVTDDQFTLKAAICRQVAHNQQTPNFTPANLTASTILRTETAESAPLATVADCMAFRIQGTLGIANSGTGEVSGGMHIQMQLDGGSWIDIDFLYGHFKEDDSLWRSRPFDGIIAVDQAAHSYKFRGVLVLDDDANVLRELTGSCSVVTVTEMGQGEILTNDLILKWTAKEDS